MNCFYTVIAICAYVSLAACSDRDLTDLDQSNFPLIAIDQSIEVYATQENTGSFVIAGDCLVLTLSDGGRFTPVFGYDLRINKKPGLRRDGGTTYIPVDERLQFGGARYPRGASLPAIDRMVLEKCNRPLFAVGPISDKISEPPPPPSL